jgi:uncharacterized protein YkwD
MGIWETVGKFAVAIIVVGGAVMAGMVLSGGDLPGSQSTSGADDSNDVDTPVVGGGAETPTPTPSEETVQTDTTRVRSALETEIHSEINDYLESEGDDPVSWEPLLQDAVRRHATAMAQDQTVARTAGGRSIDDRVSEAIVCDPRVVLIRTGAGASSASQIVDEWTSSSQTRKAITDTLNDRTYTGAVEGGDGNVYVVTVFC